MMVSDARSSLDNVQRLAASAAAENRQIWRIWMNREEACTIASYFGMRDADSVEKMRMSISGHGLVEVVPDRFVPSGHPHLEFVRAERRLFPPGETHG